ncbi:MAG TPA: tetratricopeptide repeat protein, partial [Candidatus Eisenbacteria bacterium]
RGVEPPVPASVSGPRGAVAERLEAEARSASDPREPYWPYRLAELDVALDSLPQAESALKAALSRDATYAPALALLSKLYYDAGRSREAVALLEPVRARPEAFPDPARQILLAGLALHEAALGRTDLAGAALAAAGPSDAPEAGSARVYVMLRGERPDSAAGPAAAALHDDPHSAANQNNYGITRLRAGDPAAARRAFLAAIDRDPDLPGPYYNLAILDKYYLFEDDDAARWFDAYWKRSHADPDSLARVFEAGAQRPVVQKETSR